MARRAAGAARTVAIASVPFEVLGAVVMAADAHIAKEPITCAYRKHEVFRYSTPATREDVLDSSSKRASRVAASRNLPPASMSFVLHGQNPFRHSLPLGLERFRAVEVMTCAHHVHS